MRTFDSTTLTLGAANVTTLGVFIHEEGDIGRGYSLLRGGALFYQQATTKTSGVLYLEPRGTRSTGSTTLRPSYAAMFFGRLVEFQIRNIVVGTSDNFVRSAEIRFVMRHMKDFKGTWSWCTRTQMTSVTGCAATNNYIDITKIFKVVF